MTDKLITQLPLVTTPSAADTFLLQVASTGITSVIDFAHFQAACSGTFATPTGSGLAHVTSTVLDATAYKGTNAQILVTNAGATDTAWVSMTGDVTITAAGASTVARVNGVTGWAAGGALTTGNSPYVSGVSAVTFSALNLAGGAGWVTGVLPIGNVGAPTGTGLAKVSAGAWVGAAATLVDADVNAAAAIAVSKLAAGATGQILGPTPAWTSAPNISGLVSAGSIGGYTAQAYTPATLSKSVAGGANVTLSTTEAQNRNITFTGAISADIFAIIPAGTTLVAGSEYCLTNSTTSTTPTTTAWMLNFKYASSGTGLWLPPGVPVIAVWTGSDFIYGPGSYAGGDFVTSYSEINSVGNYPNAILKTPANFHLVGFVLRVVTQAAGGATTLAVGSTSGGNEIMASQSMTGIAPGAGWPGVTLGTYGATMASTDGYTHVFSAAQTFFLNQGQATASCTAGAVSLTLRGYVVQ
jgi:hypothetical protein